MQIKQKDFVELDFTGIIKDTNQIFDTTVKEKAKLIGMEKVSSLKVCVGEGMLLKSFDSALVGKELGKTYSIELSPEKAFGERKKELVKLVPLAIFKQQDIMPYPGLMLNLDGVIAKVSSVSGGRVIMDFNNPLSGKTIIYEFRINKKLEDKKEQLQALSEFFIGTDKFELKENKAIFSGKIDKRAFDAFSKKAKELIGVDSELKAEEKKAN